VVSVFDLKQSSNYDRVCMTLSGVEMIRDYPITGVGLDMVERMYPLYRRDDAPRWRVPHLHNNIMQIAAERGLPALAAYLWLMGAFFTVTWRALPRLSGRSRAAVATSLASVVAISIAGLFEYNFWFANIQYLMLVLMGAGVGRLEEVRA
jgi:O-antigen ligase